MYSPNSVSNTKKVLEFNWLLDMQQLTPLMLRSGLKCHSLCKSLLYEFIYQIVTNPSICQYSCLENPMVGRAWQAIVHGVTRVGHDWETKPSPPPLYVRHRLGTKGANTIKKQVETLHIHTFMLILYTQTGRQRETESSPKAILQASWSMLNYLEKLSKILKTKMKWAEYVSER